MEIWAECEPWVDAKVGEAVDVVAWVGLEVVPVMRWEARRWEEGAERSGEGQRGEDGEGGAKLSGESGE
jgi:hypothetical protein